MAITVDLIWIMMFMANLRWFRRNQTYPYKLSGKLTVCELDKLWKITTLIGKSTINGPFSIANC